MKLRNFSFALLITTGIWLNCNLLQSYLQKAITKPLVEEPADCEKLNLTPEECANSGTHEYSGSRQILFDHDGKTCFSNDNNMVFTIVFQDHDSLLFRDNSHGLEMDFTRIENNLFDSTYIQPDGDFEWKTSIKFTSEGLIRESDSYDTRENLHLCKFLSTETIVTRP